MSGLQSLALELSLHPPQLSYQVALFQGLALRPVRSVLAG
jgi:hypothetical protein